MFEKQKDNNLPANVRQKEKRNRRRLFGAKKEGTEGKSTMNDAQKLSLRAVLIPLILALIVTGALWILITKEAERKVAVAEAYCARTEIPAHTYIGPDTFDSYFVLKPFYPESLPEMAVQNRELLTEEGFYTETALSKSELLMADQIVRGDARMVKYADGYSLASISADSFKSCINGSIRKGDLITIYAGNPAGDEQECLLTDVYVEDAFDISGSRVTEEGQPAISFTVRITEDELANFHLAVCYGNLYFLKNCD